MNDVVLGQWLDDLEETDLFHIAHDTNEETATSAVVDGKVSSPHDHSVASTCSPVAAVVPSGAASVSSNNDSGILDPLDMVGIVMDTTHLDAVNTSRNSAANTTSTTTTNHRKSTGSPSEGSTKEAKLARGRIAARDFRARKKKMMNQLEDKVRMLEAELKEAKVRNAVLTAENTVLRGQNQFLQSVVNDTVSKAAAATHATHHNAATVGNKVDGGMATKGEEHLAQIKRHLLSPLSSSPKRQRVTAGTLLVVLFGMALCWTCIPSAAFAGLGNGAGIASSVGMSAEGSSSLGRTLLGVSGSGDGLSVLLVLGSVLSLAGVLVGSVITTSNKDKQRKATLPTHTCIKVQ
eukprot:TRINITY_DN36814_c0_g1_i1.p1 TRINITY_DN36814_c0_g1~~TRINITY_DN36814_c0_g1_i1.p1  ORF type:complete len:370 (-),score=66.00 TRINITY_DN36814_c0_g1_i1:18-1064(-)